MLRESQRTNVNFEQLFTPILSSLSQFIALTHSEKYQDERLQRVLDQLETLPIDCDEFHLAVNRLSNAKRYLQIGECGAARWELKQLLKAIKRKTEVVVESIQLPRAQ